jgi:hypothetical protein
LVAWGFGTVGVSMIVVGVVRMGSEVCGDGRGASYGGGVSSTESATSWLADFCKVATTSP